MATTERRIYFFKIVTGWDEQHNPIPFDPKPALKAIAALPFTTEGRYLEQRDGSLLCAWPDKIDQQSRLRIGRIRRTALPQVEERGAISPLIIPPRAGLAEQTHFVFLPNRLVGWEFNFYGPRIGAIPKYFAKRATGTTSTFVLEPLLRQDVLEQLDQLQDVRLFSISARASYGAAIAKADHGLGNAFKSATQATGAGEIDLVLRPSRYSRDRLHRGLLGKLRGLLQMEETRTQVNRFEVGGTSEITGKMLTVDLLNDHLIAKRQVVLQDEATRAVSSESAYAAIMDAYRELKDDLEAAAKVDV